eukprot:scaffold133085_cov29-Tisochrysis_lutea.AAC.3
MVQHHNDVSGQNGPGEPDRKGGDASARNIARAVHARTCVRQHGTVARASAAPLGVFLPEPAPTNPFLASRRMVGV